MKRSSLNANLSEDAALIAASVAEFAREQVTPRHQELDHQGGFARELWHEMAEMGFLGSFVPAEQGGVGQDFFSHLLVIEGLSRGAGLAGALVAAQGVVLDALMSSGHQEAGERYLPDLLSGHLLGAPALMEQDAEKVTTIARGSGKRVRLSGEKLLVPHPGQRSLLLVLAEREEEKLLVLVEGQVAGVHHGKPLEVLGLRGFQMAGLRLEEAEGIVLGGGAVLERLFSGMCLAVAALLGGICRGALDHALAYARERIQFDRPISQFTAIQERLVLGEVRTEALCSLVRGAGTLRDKGLAHAQAARQARLLAAETAGRVTHDALQVFGGYGFSREYPAERFFRDARFPGFGEFLYRKLLDESMNELE